MKERLTAEGYERTKVKLRDLEARLAEIDARTDLAPEHLDGVRRSYRTMMKKYLQDLRLYEVGQSAGDSGSSA